MRINVFVANATGLSRRAADRAIAEGRVEIDGRLAKIGQIVEGTESVTLDKRAITPAVKPLTVILNKPVGYVCSRNGQGNKTVYELLPKELHHLKPVGRLDKDSSGLLLMTGDGQLAHRLTHPSFQKTKVYEIELDRDLSDKDRNKITKTGVVLEDGLSRFQLKPLGDNKSWQVTMQEGRNRQIRRTFAALGYTVTRLHRTKFGDYVLSSLPVGNYI